MSAMMINGMAVMCVVGTGLSVQSALLRYRMRSWLGFWVSVALTAVNATIAYHWLMRIGE